MRRQKAEGRRMKADGAPVARPYSSFIPHPSSSGRRGFSFTEVMFAVIILGIGFIMVAGIFPVSLQQAKMTTEEITGAAMARAGASYLSELFYDEQGGNSSAPPTGTATNPAPSQVTILTTTPSPLPAWDTVVGNLISAQDPRFAWTALYRRDGDRNNRRTWAPYAQVYVFAVTARTRDFFQLGVDTDPPAANLLANLQPKPVRVAIANDVLEAGGMDLIAIVPHQPSPATPYVGAAVSGAYVVIAFDEINNPPGDIGRMNGRMFRLGAQRVDMEPYFAIPDAQVFELQPGTDFAPDPGADGVLYDPAIPSTLAYAGDDIMAIGIPGPASSSVTYANHSAAFIVGRSYDDSGGFGGQSMVVGAYTTMVKVGTR